MEVSGRKPTEGDCSTKLQCDPCTCDGETHDAESYCTNCNEFLCKDCTKAHRKNTASKHHVLLRGDEMPQTKMASTDITCKKHDSKPFDYFCKSHNAPCCSVCLNLEHKDCSVEYIKDFVDRFDQSGEYEAFRQTMKDLDKLITESRSEMDRNVATSKQSSDKILDDVRKFRREINIVLDSLEKKVLESARKIKDEDIKAMSDLSTELDAMKGELDETTTMIENLYTLKQTKQLVITIKLAETRIDTIEMRLEKLSQNNATREYEFCLNENLLKSIKSTEELGSLREKVKSPPPDKRRIEKGGHKENQNVNTGPPVNPTFIKDINIKHTQGSNGYGCWVTGICKMDAKRLALVDCNNCSLKILDLTQSNMTSYLKLDPYPWDVTYLGNRQLVVTVPRDQSLIFLDVGDTLRVNRKLKVDGQCRGIDNTGNLLIVTFIYPGSVKLIQTDGQVMRSITTDSTGQPLFKCPHYVVSSTDRQTFFVTDRDQHTVTKLDIHGTVQTVYRGGGLRSPVGVAIESHGHVFVAGGGSGNICVIPAGGTQIQSVLNVKYPQSVLVVDDQMIASHYGDKVSVYKLY